MKKTILLDVSVIITGFVLIGVSFLWFGLGVSFALSSLLGFILMISPTIFRTIKFQMVLREKEAKFLEFTRDLVENVKSGTPVTQSIINLRRRDYGALSENVEKLANQIRLGISLESSLFNFAKETQSPMIKRAVNLISQAERAGGEIEKIIESVSASVNQVETLKKERQSSISTLTVQGYIIFIIFIGIMLVLEYMILPLMDGVVAVGVGGGANTSTADPISLSLPLMMIVLTQALFAGLVIGKLAYGKLKNGVKHSFMLILITVTIVFGARLIFG